MKKLYPRNIKNICVAVVVGLIWTFIGFIGGDISLLYIISSISLTAGMWALNELADIYTMEKVEQKMEKEHEKSQKRVAHFYDLSKNTEEVY